MSKPPLNQIFDKTSFLHGTNAVYVEEMFIKYKLNPENVPEDWKIFFSGIKEEEINSSSYRLGWGDDSLSDLSNDDLVSALDSNWSELSDKIINHKDQINISGSPEELRSSTLDSIRALRLIRAYRINGHLIANLDPLNLHKKNYHPELDYKSYGFSETDLDREIFID